MCSRGDSFHRGLFSFLRLICGLTICKYNKGFLKHVANLDISCGPSAYGHFVRTHRPFCGFPFFLAKIRFAEKRQFCSVKLRPASLYEIHAYCTNSAVMGVLVQSAGGFVQGPVKCFGNEGFLLNFASETRLYID